MDATIPIALNDPRFIAKWQEYVAYRRERRLARLLPKSTQKQWDHLSDFGLEIACQAIDMTIRQNWQGLFPERVEADRQPLGVRAGAASLGALQIQLQKVNDEIRDLRNPGGMNYPPPLTGDNKVRCQKLVEQREAIEKKIEHILKS